LQQLVLLRLHGETRTAKMRLGGSGIYHGWAEPGARRIIAVARGFDVAIGHGRRLTRRFGCGDGFLSNAALAALFGRGAARRRSRAGRGWGGVLCQSRLSPKAEQQASKQRASA
jgi:hypothetical protein